LPVSAVVINLMLLVFSATYYIDFFILYISNALLSSLKSCVDFVAL